MMRDRPHADGMGAISLLLRFKGLSGQRGVRAQGGLVMIRKCQVSVHSDYGYPPCGE